MEIQSIIFTKQKWDATGARKWLKKHNFKPIKRVHKTERYLRYRLRDPGIYSKFRTLTRDPSGILFVLGRK